MSHKEVIIKFPPEGEFDRDIIISQLSLLGFSSFWEDGDKLLAYIENENLEFDIIRDYIRENVSSDICIEENDVEDRNWNELWESNFDPIEIDREVYLHAPFHPHQSGFRYDIIIEPQMSFGTGHHETTSSMIKLMLKNDFEGKSVLDMGCGTAVLAILAKKMGAGIIWAVDNDEWAVKNSRHNIALNNIGDIKVFEGDAHFVKNRNFDIILANINRNTLLEDIAVYNMYLKRPGLLLLSGFYSDDLPLITQEADQSGLFAETVIENNDWIAAAFVTD